METRKIRLLLELRRQGISDTNVLTAIESIPREHFVDEPFLDQAYDNIALPIGSGQTISQPFIVAKMTSALELGPRMKVLEVGTGSGYQAAILSKLCRRLYSIERHQYLAEIASIRFNNLRLTNIVQKVDDGNQGWHEQAPFDRIIVTACAPTSPSKLISQLSSDGLIIFPLADISKKCQHIVKINLNSDGEIVQEKLLEVRFVPLLPGVVPNKTKI